MTRCLRVQSASISLAWQRSNLRSPCKSASVVSGFMIQARRADCPLSFDCIEVTGQDQSSSQIELKLVLDIFSSVCEKPR